MKKAAYILLTLTMLPIVGCVSGMNRKYPAYQFDNGDDYVMDGMYRIVDKNGRIGYADEKGNTIIAPRFAFGFPFENGKAIVTDSGQNKEVAGSGGEYHYWESDDWYYIDKTGRKLGKCVNPSARQGEHPF